MKQYEKGRDKDMDFSYFYSRLNQDLYGYAAALPYLFEDMTSEEKYEFMLELMNKYHELEMEGEL